LIAGSGVACDRRLAFGWKSATIVAVIRRRRAVGWGTAAFLLALGAAGASASSARLRLAYATLRGPSGFVATRDPRVSFEPGAEDAASRVAAALPDAMQRVEHDLGQPFAAAPEIYVCARQSTFETYSPNPRAGGHTLLGRIFISPKPENTPERLPSVLVHELVHLHFDQRLDRLRLEQPPRWFSEGLAVVVSGGAGAERASDADAQQAICHGATISEGWGAPARPRGSRVTGHLFYRASALFVGFLRSRSPAAFASLVREVEARNAFDEAFRLAFGAPPAALWAEFSATLPCDPAAP
jgi:hypothetical protein